MWVSGNTHGTTETMASLLRLRTKVSRAVERYTLRLPLLNSTTKSNSMDQPKHSALNRHWTAWIRINNIPTVTYLVTIWVLEVWQLIKPIHSRLLILRPKENAFSIIPWMVFRYLDQTATCAWIQVMNNKFSEPWGKRDLLQWCFRLLQTFSHIKKESTVTNNA